MSFTCNDLRLGGTLSAAGLTGGTNINTTAITVADWSGVWGHNGISLTDFEVAGRPGALLVGDALPQGRLLTLNMQITRFGPTDFLLVEPTVQEQQLANTDTFLALLANPAGNYLEVDLPDTTKRFVHATAIQPAQVNQTKKLRTISVPMFASPYWRSGGNQGSTTGGTVTNSGNVTVYDAVVTFSAAGSITNSTAGWTITVTGACVVDLGARTVTDGGGAADELMTKTDRDWGWFLPGANTVAGSNYTVTWRDAFA